MLYLLNFTLVYELITHWIYIFIQSNEPGYGKPLYLILQLRSPLLAFLGCYSPSPTYMDISGSDSALPTLFKLGCPAAKLSVLPAELNEGCTAKLSMLPALLKLGCPAKFSASPAALKLGCLGVPAKFSVSPAVLKLGLPNWPIKLQHKLFSSQKVHDYMHESLMYKLKVNCRGELSFLPSNNIVVLWWINGGQLSDGFKKTI